jgi:hypothetical protein
MKFTIVIEAKDQPGLLAGIDEARKVLAGGGSYLNAYLSSHSCDVRMYPETAGDVQEFRRQFALAHPMPKARWGK